MFNLGALLKDSDPDTAKGWWEQAAAAGDSDAMSNLGLLLEESDPDAARRWREKAAAGDRETDR
jgi:TPR repeat protein